MQTPTWTQGGKMVQDEDGNWIGVEPFTGNAAIAYARLNVRDGPKKMRDQPWSRDGHHASYPVIEGVNLSQGVDFLRGAWKEDIDSMVASMKTWHGKLTKIDFEIHKLPVGSYRVYQSGQIISSQFVGKGDVINLAMEEGGDEVDVVILRAS